MKLTQRSILLLGIIIATLMITSSSVMIYTISTINLKRNTLIQLYRLKTDILYANIHLRNAAIAPNLVSKEVELAKMLITRHSANIIYDNLSATSLDKMQSTLLQEMKNDRPYYREAQLQVVKYIRLSDDDSSWVSMLYYNTLMDRYLQRVSSFCDLIVDDITSLYTFTKYLVMITSFIVIILTSILVYNVAKILKLSKINLNRVKREL